MLGADTPSMMKVKQIPARHAVLLMPVNHAGRTSMFPKRVGQCRVLAPAEELV
jgi:hypothetical protein